MYNSDFDLMEFIGDVLMIAIAIILWLIAYIIYFSSGIKLIIDPKQFTWDEQMTWWKTSNEC